MDIFELSIVSSVSSAARGSVIISESAADNAALTRPLRSEQDEADSRMRAASRSGTGMYALWVFIRQR